MKKQSSWTIDAVHMDFKEPVTERQAKNVAKLIRSVTVLDKPPLNGGYEEPEKTPHNKYQRKS